MGPSLARVQDVVREREAPQMASLRQYEVEIREIVHEAMQTSRTLSIPMLQSRLAANHPELGDVSLSSVRRAVIGFKFVYADKDMK